MLQKKRILVTISISFAVRYIIRTGLLDMMRKFCEPVVLLSWNQQDLINELIDKGIEVHVMPSERRNPAYVDVRRKINFWFEHFRLNSNSRIVQQKYLDQFLPFKYKLIRNARRFYNLINFYFPFYIQWLFELEVRLMKSDTNFNEISLFVDSLSIDAVFSVTPFHRQEDLLLRVCKGKGKFMITSILSFDNITKRGWIPVEYDVYIVWNQQNMDQLHRIYPFTKDRQVHICGPAQFDFYFDKNYLIPYAEWKELVGLSSAQQRKIILYAGGPKELFPQEPNYLKQIDDAISVGLIRDKPLILFRCHPMDKIERWKSLTSGSGNIVFDRAWDGDLSPGNANVTVDDIKKLCSTLAYTDVHVNICSTMTIDGTIFDKPQIGPAYSTVKSESGELLSQMYLQEHFRPILEAKMLNLANSLDELINLINDALDDGNTSYLGKKEKLSSVITYCDGKSASRVADVIKRSLP